MKSCSPGSLAQPEKPGKGSFGSWYRNGGYCSVLTLPHFTLSKLLFSILLAPYFVSSLGFLSEIQQHWKQTHSWFCLRLSLPSTYSGFVCPVLLFAWLNAIPGKMFFWASRSQWLAFSVQGKVRKFLVQGFDMSACVSVVWCQDALCQ